MTKPNVITTRKTLPFGELSPLEFEHMCLWLIEREGYLSPQHLGQAGSDQGRDIAAYKRAGSGEELWYFQCKRYDKIGAKALKEEVKKYIGLSGTNADKRPAGVVFITNATVSARARDDVGKFCEEHGYKYEFWARTELDMLVKKHPDIIREFFDAANYPHASADKPFQAPPLPPHFVHRSGVVEQFKKGLLAKNSSEGLTVSVLHGLGGVGKTTLASALVRDPEVRQCYPDGVLWVTLSQEPDLLSLLHGWIVALKDFESRFADTSSATAHLRSLLHDKATLLVIDDAWDHVHVEAFLVGGPKCKVLITTRDALVAKVIKASLYDLDVMTPAESLALLLRQISRPVGSLEHPLVIELAHQVGHLPLALELVAAQINDGIGCKELISALRAETRRLEALDLAGAGVTAGAPAYKGTSLTVSFNLTIKRLSGDERRRFAVLGVLPEDARFTPDVASTLWETDERTTRLTLRRLSDLALLRLDSGSDTGGGVYHLHDLIGDAARQLLVRPVDPEKEGEIPGLGLTLPYAHRKVLERYSARTRRGQWHTLPDDGYILGQLAWHMWQADAAEMIHALLNETDRNGGHGWHQAQEKAGQISIFLRDVQWAWEAAEQGGSEEAAGGGPIASLPLTIRYALMDASVRTMAGNIPPELLELLVTRKMLSPVQAMEYARRSTSLQSKATSLMLLSSVLPDPLGKNAYLEALSATRLVAEGDWQPSALSIIAPKLPEEMRGEIFEPLLERLESSLIGGEELFICIAPYLPAAMLRRAIQVAKHWEHGYGQVMCLCALVPRLPDPMKSLIRQEVLRLTDEAADVNDYARCLTAVVSQLDEPRLDEALQAVWGMTYYRIRPQLLAALVPKIPEPDKSEVIKEVLEFALNDFMIDADLVMPLLPCLSAPLLREVLRLVRARGKTIDIITILSGIARRLPQPESDELLLEAFSCTRAIGDVFERVKLLAACVPHIAESRRGELLREIEQSLRAAAGTDRINILSRLFPLYESGQVPKAWANQIFLQSRDAIYEFSSTNLLPAVVDGLEEPVKTEIVEEILNFNHGDYWLPHAVAAIAPYLSEAQLSRAVSAVQEISNTAARPVDAEYDRATGLVALLPYLPERKRRAMLPIVVDSFDLAYEQPRIHGLNIQEVWLPSARLLPEKWRDKLLRNVFEYASSQEPFYQSLVMAALVPYVEEPLRSQALRLAIVAPIADGENSDGLDRVLPELGPHLTPEIAEEAFVMLRNIKNRYRRLRDMSLLAPHLPPRLRARAVESVISEARIIKETGEWTEAISYIVPEIPDSLVEEFLNYALSVDTKFLGRRESMMSRMAARIAGLPRNTAYSYLSRALRSGSALNRGGVLTDLSVFILVIYELGGSEAITETFWATQDVYSWWP